MENAPLGPPRARIHLAPTTTAGLWAARLLVAFLAGVVVYISLFAAYAIITGERPSDNLRVPLLVTTDVAGLLAGVAAAFAVFRRGERSLLGFLGLIVLLFIAIFFVGELVGHD